MAILVYYRKLSEDASTVRYAFGGHPAETDRVMTLDKASYEADPDDGGRTFGFHATVRGIARTHRASGTWPEHGMVAH
ncbi:hypothetical protein ACG5V6_25705 [Streptomyces chitinivorans]|uniref:Uncharacterized protein n=1 Tax=Streptomyces chitinivorans TaxID=1257027 RepID=A0ABW7I0Q6_9ACTN|nr:hypothetical protein [Streptomyces chitinivorans]MDH2407678.1 hypothetical protein [Streptomyces chitinivorans]